MDKIKNILKKNLKLSTAVLASIILCGGSVYATILLSSGEVSYTNNGQSNVEGALDNLYTLASTAANKECQEGYGKVEVEANGAYRCLPIPSFATSSWSDIVAGYNAGITTQLQADMEAGVTRDVDLGSLGVHPVRIANLTKCSEVSVESKSACGLVIEFADVITTHRMNPYSNSGNSNGDGNKGGWEYSDMRAFVNSSKYQTQFEVEMYDYSGIYSNIPSELRNLIIDTTVVSGHGSNDSSNFTTIDKLYLLSTIEVWNGNNQNDSASGAGITRQLDYYERIGVTASNYSGAIKKLGTSASEWWLRSACSYHNNYFHSVRTNGGYNYSNADYTFLRVSPAFRLAE